MTVVALLIFFDFATLYLILALLFSWALWIAVPVGLAGVLIVWLGFALALKFG